MNINPLGIKYGSVLFCVEGNQPWRVRPAKVFRCSGGILQTPSVPVTPSLRQQILKHTIWTEVSLMPREMSWSELVGAIQGPSTSPSLFPPGTVTVINCADQADVNQAQLEALIPKVVAEMGCLVAVFHQQVQPVEEKLSALVTPGNGWKDSTGRTDPLLQWVLSGVSDISSDPKPPSYFAFSMYHDCLVRDETALIPTGETDLGPATLGCLGLTTLPGVLREIAFKVGLHPKYGA